jgi:uncharacterized protein involved in cysteine biosynthesis
VGFFRGFFAPFRGAAFVARERLWRYVLVPLLLNLALGVTTAILVGRYEHAERAELLVSEPVPGWILVVVLAILGGAVLFIVAQPIFSAVFSDRLSEIVEKRVRGVVPKGPFWSSIGHALVHALLKLVLYGLALVIGFLLTTFVLPIGIPVGLGLGALFLAYDGFDYPLSRRGATFGGKWVYLALHPAMTVGFAIGATVMYFIPLAVLVAPSFTAAGATLAFLETDAKATARREGRAAAAEKKAAEKKADHPADKNVLVDAVEDKGEDRGNKEAENPHKPIDISAS